ncbi:MAG: RHS repeat-associated core domain-containing protein, partial [Alphaproteobacteria bacterium]|nr:RHS repeat-associated core domain-containing protein [Alphaproteobacteria bacterium]
HLATPRAGTNAAGSTVWTWDSGAFGKEAATGSATVNLRFPGQYYDAETGLHYNWNRTYNPATGRYVSSDPIGLAGGLNTFGYASQSPVVFFDTDGYMAIPLPPPTIPLPPPGLPGYPPGQTPTPEWGWPIPPSCPEEPDKPNDQQSIPEPAENGHIYDDEQHNELCEGYYRKIDIIVGEIKTRYTEARIDKYDLFNQRKYGPKFTWQSHEEEYKTQQKRLRETLKAAENAKCFNYRRDAWKWATEPYPTAPAPK